jgi:epoxyqueuosine reductase
LNGQIKWLHFNPAAAAIILIVLKKWKKTTFPVEKSLCGNCSICVEECPAGAGSGRLWDIHTGRDSFFDAFACKNKCRELSLKSMGKNITIWVFV